MRKSLIEKGHPQLSVRRQADLLNVNRNRLSSSAPKFTPEELELCLEIDKLYMLRPYYGHRRIAVDLQARGFKIGRGRCRRLMRHMGLVAIYPKPRTSVKSPENKVYPYLLRNLKVERPNQVWCSDISVPQQSCMRDEGKAPRNRLTGAGCKPPQAAWVKSSGRERCGKGTTRYQV